MSQTSNNLANYCWSIADLLRGDFKQSQYGRIILPFTLLRRLECVLEPTKQYVLAEDARLQQMPVQLPDDAQEKFLLKASAQAFFNVSRMDLGSLGEHGIKANLERYLLDFSFDAREIFEYFNFAEFIAQLNDANLLYKVVQHVKKADLNPARISNHDMGLVFEELIRRFAESSNETAGEHFTPRDIVRLTTSLVFAADDDVFDPDKSPVRTIYDPTAGTGGFLSSGMEFVHEHNETARMVAFGQELNPESYAICKADMLIKGQKVENIKLGNTLSGDQLPAQRFDYMLSNPPFGVDWKKVEGIIKQENALKGFTGRFGPGLPRVSDGSLLFLLHLISKLPDAQQGGGRIGIILNGSPLFTGGAGSGESEIRRYILEADLLEAIVALPTDMFYNTGIATYIWVLTNKKSAAAKGKIQLINAVHLYQKMRKSLGSKRNVMGEDDLRQITRTYGAFEAVGPIVLDKEKDVKSNRGRQAATPAKASAKTFAAKLFNNHEFGFRRITVERPLRMSFQFSAERVDSLRFAAKPLTAAMQWVYETYGRDWSDAADCAHYGQLAAHEAAIRKQVKQHFSELKEAKVKELLDVSTWLTQKRLLLKARSLRAHIGNGQHDDFNPYETTLLQACRAQNVKLEAKEKKQIEAAVSWKNPAAKKVRKKIHKGAGAAANLYGLFAVDGGIVEYKPDSELRDYENIALDPALAVDAVNEAYFRAEVLPHVAEAWIDGTKQDAKDNEVGIVGYEIPFNRHFYVYQPPRDLGEIDADLAAVSKEIMGLLREVGSV